MIFAPGYHLRRWISGCVAATALLLVACGGGGSSDSVEAPVTPNTAAAARAAPFAPSSTLAGVCTLDGQQKFVRSYLDENYLWYNEIPNVDPAAHSTVSSYFNALLVRTLDVVGQTKDRFSAALTSTSANALQSVALGGPADAVMADLLSATTKSVPQAKTVSSIGGRQAGYILFNDHNAGAQDTLIAAFESLRSSGIRELVLDMRYNPGGFLYVAQAVASMVAGPQSEGRVFEQLRYNDKRPAETAASAYLFSSRLETAEKVYPRGHAVPQLNLPRLYVLTSGRTCSASESIINSLRGIDVEVILIGDTTCGKPYGFHRKDNCGLAFFAVEFQGYNAKNFGDYTSGFPATCHVADSPTSTLGSTGEPLLAAALHHIDTGSCPAAMPSKGVLARDPRGMLPENPTPASQPAWDGRLLKLGQ